jgi:hypothetical protein
MELKFKRKRHMGLSKKDEWAKAMENVRKGGKNWWKIDKEMLLKGETYWRLFNHRSVRQKTTPKKTRKRWGKKKFAFLCKPKVVTILTIITQWTLRWSRRIQFKIANYFFKIHFNIILPYTPVSQSGLFYSGIQTNIFIHTMRVTRPVNLIMWTFETKYSLEVIIIIINIIIIIIMNSERSGSVPVP